MRGGKVVKIGRSKYGNHKVDGFDSKREKRRFNELNYLLLAGEITDLRTQVTFELIPKNDKYRSLKYIADFTYIDKNGKYVVEDAKGYKTYHFTIKQKLMYDKFRIDVQCV